MILLAAKIKDKISAEDDVYIRKDFTYVEIQLLMTYYLGTAFRNIGGRALTKAFPVYSVSLQGVYGRSTCCMSIGT